MKKTKISLFIAVILLFSILLTSCSNKKVEKTLDTLFVDTKNATDEVFTNIEEINAKLDRYSVSNNYYFDRDTPIAVLKKTEFQQTKYKIYSLITKSFILELDYPNLQHDIYVYPSANYFTVKYVTEERGKTYTEVVAYDFMGNVITSNVSGLSPTFLFEDTIALNGFVYKIDREKGTLEKIEGIDSFSIPTGSKIYNNDNYVYFSNYTAKTKNISVYNRELEQIFSYNLPSYFENTYYQYFNDGKIFLQARIKLESDAEEYDYYITSETQKSVYKYDSQQYLIDPIKGSVKEIDIGYMLSEISSNYDLQKENNAPPLYSENFENIAFVYPIVDKKLDSSASSKKIVFMDNNAKITGEINILEGQSPNLPQKIDENRYFVKMLDGTYTLIDRQGNIIASNIISPEKAGNYIISNDAVYDLDMKLVYDTREVPAGTSAIIIGNSDEDVFISESTGLYQAFYKIKDGEKQLITDRMCERTTEYDAFEPIEIGYIIRNLDENKVALYNFNGQKIADFDKDIFVKHCASFGNTHLIMSNYKLYLVS